MQQQHLSLQQHKELILKSFRKSHLVNRDDDTINWVHLQSVLQHVCGAFWTEARAQELQKLTGTEIIEGRVRLEPFINWIFGDRDSEAGNLKYPVTQEQLDRARAMVNMVRDSMEPDPVSRVQKVLRHFWPKSSDPRWSRRGELKEPERRLLFVYTDLEPDDIMAIAQLWEWKAEGGRLDGEPLLVAQLNFESKDGGQVLEKKQLLVSLILGVSRYYLLTREGDDGQDRYKMDNSWHPQMKQIVDRRQEQLHQVCEELVNFGGKFIDFYIMSPGHGNLGAILRTLKEMGKWPPSQAKWRISLYSGSFNMRNMKDEDLEAIREIVSTCGGNEPLLDVGKFPFFGGQACHPFTDSLTTFAMPRFAQDLTEKCPVHAAMLRLFNDEFNAVLIDPDSDTLFKSEMVWTEEEKARFASHRVHYKHDNPEQLQRYAAALWDDPAIRAKLREFKKSTVRAYKYGACDSPLCDQLIFLYEWLCSFHPTLLKYEEGYWQFDRAKGFTVINQEGPGLPAKRPIIADPTNCTALLEMSDALETYLLRHLYALDCHITKQSGLLVYSVTKHYRDKLDTMIEQLRTGQGVDNVIKGNVPGWSPWGGPAPTSERLMVVYTDLEPDDAMAIAQLWEWKREVQNMAAEPLVITGLDFKTRDGGRILEKKELLFALMLGVSRHYMLTPEWDTTGKQDFACDGSVHPRNQQLQLDRNSEIDSICKALEEFQGSSIDFYVIAPGHGNIAAIVDRLEKRGSWPLPRKPRWRVMLYSGQFNMSNMLQGDIEALGRIMACSDDQPLVDVGKFPFFGGKECHPWTDSLTTFASPSLAGQLSAEFPLLAGLLKTYNDEFNAGLVNPKTKKFFKKTPLSPEEQQRYDAWTLRFDYLDAASVQEFCKCVCEDAAVYGKLPDFKKSTFRAFAHGGCDSPLCDQLLFAYEYLANKAAPEENLSTEEGLWFFDPEGPGYTEIGTARGSFRAVRPSLKEPRNEVVLTELRFVFEQYLIRHLRSPKGLVTPRGSDTGAAAM